MVFIVIGCNVELIVIFNNYLERNFISESFLTLTELKSSSSALMSFQTTRLEKVIFAFLLTAFDADQFHDAI